MIGFGVPSLVLNMDLLTKIYFPREILPIAPLCAGLLDFALGLLFFIALLIYYQIPITLMALWLPVIFLVQFMLILGIVLLLSAFNVFYRDIKYVIPLLIQLWFYATPIIYPMTVVPEWMRPYYSLNPMAGIVDSYRQVMLFHQPPSTLALGTAFVVAVGLVIFGYIYFKKVEWQFADVI